MKTRLEDDDDDEDHGGLVKKIMETKKEYEQTRKTEIVSQTYNRDTNGPPWVRGQECWYLSGVGSCHRFGHV